MTFTTTLNLDHPAGQVTAFTPIGYAAYNTILATYEARDTAIADALSRAVVADTGYIIHPCGLIEMWGTATPTISGVAVTFPLSGGFPNAVFGVVPTPPNSSIQVAAASLTATGFTFTASANAGVACFWTAKGH